MRNSNRIQRFVALIKLKRNTSPRRMCKHFWRRIESIGISKNVDYSLDPIIIAAAPSARRLLIQKNKWHTHSKKHLESLAVSAILMRIFTFFFFKTPFTIRFLRVVLSYDKQQLRESVS